MKVQLWFVLAGLGGSVFAADESAARADDRLADYLITIADDFVVEVYHDGQRVPDSARELILERFGATGEKIKVAVKRGDWLVFHVVANRLRWEGSKYFAVAGCFETNSFGFVSDPASPEWSACDDPARLADFIARKEAGRETRARKIELPWSEGDVFIKQFAGDGFHGQPLWGGAASTWIKYVAAPATLIEDPERVTETKPAATPKPAAMLDPRRMPVQILSATYGTQGKNADVTARVKQLVEEERRKFSASPKDLGADPVPYWNKGLHIIYMKDGVKREQHRNENEHVLPESFYGPQDAGELRTWLVESRWYGEQPDLQFHADQTFTSPGGKEPGRWKAIAANKLSLTWPEEGEKEFKFDYTWSNFSETGNARRVYHLVR